MRLAFVAGLFVVVSAAAGCTASPTSDADRFREPLPEQSDVALDVPGNTAQPGAVTTKSAGLHVATGNGGNDTASSYQFTRAITGAVDVTTAVILGGIWAIVHAEPTSIEAKKAVWGPGSANALDPAVWRFTVTEVGDAEYDYVLEGQNKSGGDWLPVLNGHGYGKSRAEHRQGWFLANNDNYETLDPANGHDEGTTKITFDLKQLPATIDVELRPAPAKGSLDIGVTHEAGGGGKVTIAGTTDIDDAKNTKLETVAMTSRWNATGAGRSDWSFAGGDLPIASVTASECWSATFSRVFYKDSVDYQPATGDAGTCAFSAADQ